MNIVILDTSTFNNKISWQAVEAASSSIDFYQQTTPDQILDRAKDADIVVTNKVVISESTIANLPNLKLICIAATGTNNVDLAAAKSANVAVTNVSGYAKHSVAQHIFAYLLAVTNQTQHNLTNTQTGKWQQSQVFCLIDKPIVELTNMTIGLLGYGSIAKQVHQIASAFGMKVLISETPNAEEIRTGRIPFEDMLSNSDIVSIHCPLTPQTQELFDDVVISKMKSGAILVNTARGQIIHDESLITALKSGKLSHAIIDVIDQEPPAPNHPLLQRDIPNVSLTAHIAWGSTKAQQSLVNTIGNNIASFTKGGTLNRVA